MLSNIMDISCMMYLTHGLSHCDAENRETGGCRVAESGVPFLNIGLGDDVALDD